MSSSGYAHLWYGSAPTKLFCTDEDVIEDILTALQALLPSCRVHRRKGLDGRTYWWDIRNCQGQDLAMAFWLIAQLCARGWEPFETQHDGISSQHIHLRTSGA